jgi:hypothetical protein
MNRGDPPENGETPVGAGAPLKTATKTKKTNQPKVTDNTAGSRPRIENFLSVPASQSQLVRSLPRPARAKEVRLYSNKALAVLRRSNCDQITPGPRCRLLAIPCDRRRSRQLSDRAWRSYVAFCAARLGYIQIH